MDNKVFDINDYDLKIGGDIRNFARHLEQLAKLSLSEWTLAALKAINLSYMTRDISYMFISDFDVAAHGKDYSKYELELFDCINYYTVPHNMGNSIIFNLSVYDVPSILNFHDFVIFKLTDANPECIMEV